MLRRVVMPIGTMIRELVMKSMSAVGTSLWSEKVWRIKLIIVAVAF